MNNYDELLNRLRDTTHIPYHIHTMEAADAIESLQALLNEYKDAECRAVKLHGEAEARVKELEALLAIENGDDEA